ncbi:gamma-aminobutyric acid receptor alpha-like [Lepeophtheirus salmonis]|uniref:gamma-aminobutyric acid receptor alpha-like n=1 Tax=Lepeophtheirus salmonis TaxID=72036 RepID=UPI003AF3D533
MILPLSVFLVFSSKLFYGTSGCNQYLHDFCDTYEEHVQQHHDQPPHDHRHHHGNRNKTKRSSRIFYRRQDELSSRVSRTLDALLSENRYDRQIRPQIGDSPIKVSVNFAIRSMGPVDEQKQLFLMDCYFRQYWTDPRLVYNSSKLNELPMNWQFLTKIWRPDTFIINGKNSYLHKMTVPNRFIRISPDGRISYSQRLTVKARCEMDLRKFPLDSQHCPLEIGSFGHGVDEILYNWTSMPLSMDKKTWFSSISPHFLEQLCFYAIQ